MNMQSSNHKAPASEAIARLHSAKELVHNSVMNILTLAQNMQELSTEIPEHPTKAQLISAISQLYQYCCFEDLASQHITQAICLWSNTAQRNSLTNGPAINTGDVMSQDDIDKLLGGK
jgi:chemotaxis regulatin CheY-phosphate phosphatase CheZ